MNLSLILPLIVLIHQSATDAVILTECEIAQNLKNNGFDQINDWTCLIESESAGKSDAVGGPNVDGSMDFGFFQINDKYWCNNNNGGANGCNIDCQTLLNGDFSAGVPCAKLIFQQRGFAAWNGWKKKCAGGAPDVSSCLS